MTASLILVVGVSGIGKTTLCRRLVDAVKEVNHIKASAFVGGIPSDDQVGLSVEIRRYADSLKGPSVVDGHLVMAGRKVPLAAIEALAPMGVIMLVESPEEVIRRRDSDCTRTRPKVTEEEISRAQGDEEQWAREVARALGTPFAVLGASDETAFIRQVRQMLRLTPM